MLNILVMRKFLIVAMLLLTVTVTGQIGRYPFYSMRAPVDTDPEMLSDGDFGSADPWGLSAQFSITGGQLIYDATANGYFLQTDANMQSSVIGGETYILKFDGISTDYKIDFYVFDSSGLEYYNLHVSYEGIGTALEFEFTTPVNIGSGGIRFSASNWAFVIDNISLTVKP